MFGLSFTKLLVLAAVAAIVWYGFKAVRRRDERRAEAARPPKNVQPATELMVKCPVCGTYNPTGVVCTHRP
jgi:threonine/homoserine/homoserine lactone efflux protein